VLVFVLGLLLGTSNPAKEEEREFLHYHGKAVSIFVLGLLLGSSNPAKEEEREFLHYHGKAVLTFCRTP
jgi:uncharacterized protein YifE (UPF0438 family)